MTTFKKSVSICSYPMPVLCLQGSVEERIMDMVHKRQTGSGSQSDASAAVSNATATAGHKQVALCLLLIRSFVCSSFIFVFASLTPVIFLQSGYNLHEAVSKFVALHCSHDGFAITDPAAVVSA